MTRTLPLLSLLATGACGVLPAPGSSSSSDPIRLESDAFSATTNQSGKFQVQLDVPEDAVAFQITADSDVRPAFSSVVDPSGKTVLDSADWFDSPEQITLSFFAQRTTTALNWPIREIDGPLAPGLWTVHLVAIDGRYYASRSDVDVSTDLKFDPDLSTGHISVQVVWANGVDKEKGVAEAVEAATDRWAEIWGKQGIEMSYHYVTSNLDPRLKFTDTGAEGIRTVSEIKEPGELQLIIGDMVGNQQGTFGVSAGIPGTVEPSPSTYVVLAWMTHAGPDGKFDKDEIRLMGETMAHECAHYTGLFHPVESTYRFWDALDDTPECQNENSCDSQLGQNVMYPYPICTSQSCNPQGQLTDEQGRVMNQFVGAL